MHKRALGKVIGDKSRLKKKGNQRLGQRLPSRLLGFKKSAFWLLGDAAGLSLGHSLGQWIYGLGLKLAGLFVFGGCRRAFRFVQSRPVFFGLLIPLKAVDSFSFFLSYIEKKIKQNYC
jgi:hypothetical protein